ncbi:MAG: hypothetical protein SWO11_10430 [Thermodesulfobacteriota bacterium]|nr:hypothetical protein [Thermodesulfobacteriota bacterium]
MMLTIKEIGDFLEDLIGSFRPFLFAHHTSICVLFDLAILDKMGEIL